MPQITLVCPICQKHFESYSSENRKYCCHHCSRIALQTREFIPCPICKSPFIPVGISGGGKTKTCSSKCGGILRTSPPETLFWRSVNRTGLDDCWLWKGTLVGGYGVFTISGKPIKAHRFSYQLHKGPIPEGMVVMHSCDNPPCVNPRHLSIGTNLENIQDCINKGRRKFGNAKLNRTIAEQIRVTYNSGRYTYDELAFIFSVGPTTISRIIHNQSWHD